MRARPRNCRVVVPATGANLGPGFDAVAMALQLYLSLDVQWTDGPCQEVQVVGSAGAEATDDGVAMARAAAAAGLRLAGREGLGYRLRVHSDIPTARGLGSSAALRVACLLAATADSEEVPRSVLAAEAARLEGHPDNSTAALEGGTVVVAASAEELSWVKLRTPEHLVAVVAVPGVTVATDQSRAALPEAVPFEDAVFDVARAALLVAGLERERFDVLAEAMDDRLHQPYRLDSIPGAREAIRRARESGAKGAALSGSGPAVLALCDRRERKMEAVARAMEAAFEEAGVPAECLVLSPDNDGARVTPA